MKRAGLTVRYIGREYIDMAVQKLNVLSKITDSGLVAIVRADNASDAARIVEACAGRRYSDRSDLHRSRGGCSD
jgi:hypothetical protein